MFCSKCGNKLNDDAKFCTACGAKIEETVAAPVEETVAAPVEETASAPVEEPASAPVEEPVSAPVEEPVSAPVEEPVSAPVEEPVSAPVEEPVSAPVEETVSAPVEEPVAATSPAPKKKSKKGLIIGLCAGGVLVGAAAVGYFCFHSDITHLFMGDAGYAKMIEEKSYSGKFNDMTMKAAETALGETLDVLFMSRSENSAVNTISDVSPDELFQSIGANADINVKEYLDKYLSMIIPEGKGISAENSIDIKLNNILTAMISGAAGDSSPEDIEKLLNSLRYSAKVINGDTDVIGFSLNDENGAIGGAEIYFGADNTVAVKFPEITDKVFYADLNEIGVKETADEKAPEKAPEKAKLSEEELERILKKIARIYIDSYDKADIKFTKGVSHSFAGTEIEGIDVSASFTAETMLSMVNKLGDFFANDEYLCNYACETYGLTAESYKEIFKEADAKDFKGGFVITNVVDNHNNGIGKTIVFDNGGEQNETAFIEMFSKDMLSAFRLTINGKEENNNVVFEAVSEKENEGTGKSNLKAVSGGATLSVDVIYNDVKTEKFFGKDVITGSVTIKPAADNNLMDKILEVASETNTGDRQTAMLTSADFAPEENNNGNPMSAIQSMITSEFSKIECNIDAKLENGVYTNSFNVTVGNLGSIGYTSRLTEIEAGNVTMPDKANAIDVVNISGEEADAVLVEVVKDAVNWLKKTSERVPVIGAMLGGQIDELIAELEKEEVYKKHYADYTTNSEYTAVDYAERIYDNYVGAVSETLSTGEASFTKGTIKLYFDSECNLTVLDDAGMDIINYVMPSKIENVKNAYAEILFDKRTGDYIVGVTVVLTDNAQDIPGGLPDEFNYIDNVYNWEDEKTNYIGEYVVGCYPYVYNGTPYTTDEMLGGFSQGTPADKSEKLKENITVLNEAARLIAEANGKYPVQVRSNSMSVSLVISCNKYGVWEAETAYEGRFDEKPAVVFEEETITALLEVLGDNKEAFVTLKNSGDGFTAELIYSRGNLIGVNAVMGQNAEIFSDYGMPSENDYEKGTFTWGGADGSIWGNPTIGCYVGASGEPMALGTYSVRTNEPLVSEYPTYVSPEGLNGVWAIEDVYGLEEDGEDELIEMLSDVTFEIYDGYIIVNAFYESQQYRLDYSDDGITVVDGDEAVLNLYYDADNQSVTLFESAYSEEAITLKKVGELDTNKPEIYTASADTSAIAGLWIIPENEMTLDEGIAGYEIAVTENGMIIPGGMGSISVDDIYYLIPDGDKYRMCIDQSGRCLTAPEYYDDGTAWYDEANDVFMMETGGIQAVFERESYAEKDCKFIGEWVLSEYDGLPVEAIEEVNDDAMMIINVSSFGMLVESRLSISDSVTNYSIINVINPREFSIYQGTEEQAVSETYVYDDATDTLKCTIKFPDASSDEPQSIELVFKRRTYTAS